MLDLVHDMVEAVAVQMKGRGLGLFSRTYSEMARLSSRTL